MSKNLSLEKLPIWTWKNFQFYLLRLAFEIKKFWKFILKILKFGVRRRICLGTLYQKIFEVWKNYT